LNVRFRENAQKPIDIFPRTQGSKNSPRHQSKRLVQVESSTKEAKEKEQQKSMIKTAKSVCIKVRLFLKSLYLRADKLNCTF